MRYTTKHSSPPVKGFRHDPANHIAYVGLYYDAYTAVGEVGFQWWGNLGGRPEMVITQNAWLIITALQDLLDRLSVFSNREQDMTPLELSDLLEELEYKDFSILATPTETCPWCQSKGRIPESEDSDAL